MKKKFILISGIASVATLAVAGLAVARGNTVLADPVAPGYYVATIDQNNKLRVDGSDYFFNLHGGGEYGYFVRKEYVDTLSISIDPNDNYGFSISMAGEDYFGFTMEDLTLDVRSKNGFWDVEVDGKTKTVRGFPGAYQTTIVYDAPEGYPLSRTPSSNNSRWNLASSKQVGSTYTETYTTKETLPDARLSFLFTRPYTEEDKDQVHTYNIRSLSIYYTC